MLPLVPELLSTHPFFDTAEPDMDDPACILCWLSRKFWPLFLQCSFGGLKVLDFVFSFSFLLVKSISWGNLVIIIFLSFRFCIHNNSPLPLNTTTNFLAIYWIPIFHIYIFHLLFKYTIFHMLFKYFIYFITDLPNNPGRRLLFPAYRWGNWDPERLNNSSAANLG